MATFAKLPWGFGVAFSAIGLLVAGMGWSFLLIQHYRLAAYLPVPAHIVESHVASYLFSGSNKPVIRYTYLVNAHSYESDRICAIGNFWTNGTWPWEIRARFPAGATATAWYSRRDPRSSYLYRGVVFFPYVVAMAGFLFILTGIYAFFLSIHGRSLRRPSMQKLNGASSLRPEFSLRTLFALPAIATFIWYTYYALVLADYLIITRDPSSSSFIVPAAITGGIGFISIYYSGRAWRLYRHFGSSQVVTQVDHYQLGEPVRLRLNQKIRRSTEITELSLGAACLRSDRFENRSATGFAVSYSPAVEVASVHKRLDVNRRFGPGSHVSVDCEFILPLNAKPSTPPDSDVFPMYLWFIVMEVRATHQPKLRIRFPITVIAVE